MNRSLQQQISILVVEDDPGDLGLIRAYVSRAGLRRVGDRDPVVWTATLVEGVALAVCQPARCRAA
jgi:hypothetical protein